MKRRRPFFNPYGLRIRFAICIAVAALVSLLVFFVLHNGIGWLLTEYFEQSDFERTEVQKQVESLQKYIRRNSISSQTLGRLKGWEKSQPVIILMLFSGSECIYSSYYETPVNIIPYEEDPEPVNNRFKVELADSTVTAVLYSDFTYRFYIIGNCFAAAAALILFALLFFRSVAKTVRYICMLNDEVQILEGGDMDYPVTVKGNDELTDLAKSMNRMRAALKQQFETEQRLNRKNRQLVSEMSHDLRTPLTGMMLYIEILRTHKYRTEAEMADYLEKIDTKAHHMKLISDHLFEYAMDNRPGKQTEPVSAASAFSGGLKGFGEELEAKGFRIGYTDELKDCFVQTDPEYMTRILGNIASNIGKYAAPGSKIEIEYLNSEKYCGFSVMNLCAEPVPGQESNGIGVASIRTMMQQMEGVCTVERTDTCYEITLLFPKR